jgi:hypothetical protein
MAGLRDQPDNMNPLTDVQFKFEVGALPETSFFVQGCNIPGITVTANAIGVPKRSGGFGLSTGVIEYETLEVTFLVDEYLKNWEEVYNWMVNDVKKTSAVLTILSSSMNPTMEFHFSGVFPTNLGAITFDSTTTDPTYIQATITFNFTDYKIKRLTN